VTETGKVETDLTRQMGTAQALARTLGVAATDRQGDRAFTDAVEGAEGLAEVTAELSRLVGQFKV
jgi:hypothetical protein